MVQSFYNGELSSFVFVQDKPEVWRVEKVASEAEQIQTAAQTAMRTASRRAAAQQRRPNPAIDMSPDRLAALLELWASQDAGDPKAYRTQGPLLVPQPRGTRLYVAAGGLVERVINLDLEPVGSVIWTVVNCTVQGRACTMLLGAVRLKNGEWSVFRQTAVKRGNDVVFETDQRWYHNRVKRSKQRSKRSQ